MFDYAFVTWKIIGVPRLLYTQKAHHRGPPTIPHWRQTPSLLPGPCLDALRRVFLARNAEGQTVPGNGLERAIGAKLTRSQRYDRDYGRRSAACWVCRLIYSYGEDKSYFSCSWWCGVCRSSSSRPWSQKYDTTRNNKCAARRCVRQSINAVRAGVREVSIQQSVCLVFLFAYLRTDGVRVV